MILRPKKVGFCILVVILLGFVSCKKEASPAAESILFDLKDNKSIGVDFVNTLTDTKEFNVYKYRNYYNGGGVAIGDINNDGLQDIYMVSNQSSNKLYLNKGNWKFEDITNAADCGGQKAWSTGVTMVDINADGFLDIYVCNSGDVKGDNKENELFINQGNNTFKESAKEYGLNDPGFSTHASFFDYDKDGDLDVYILNNSFQAIGSFNLRKNERPVRDALGGDKLMENKDGKFVDVSEKAGIYGSVIGFGLGITIGDVNRDGWEDIYISNDFFERDYLYINQKNGTFKEDLTSQIMATSAASMGADIADVNNDGFIDIFVTDMLPYDYERLKSVTTFDDWDRYNYGVSNGYHHQFTRNTFQKNNGNNTFSEISRFSGVEASDWSWGALFFDMDNDGNKDLYIANGIYRDLTDQDYLQYIANESVMTSIIKEDGVNYKELIDIIPSRPIANQAYYNRGNFNFEISKSTGLMSEGFSNGSAYGDLDNDGDLDLVVNNVNMPCFIYENQASQTRGNSYIKIQLKGAGENPNAVGAYIIATDEKGLKYHYENQPARGFQSCMDQRINIGLGKAKNINLEVLWPSGKVSTLTNVKVNQLLNLDEKDAVTKDEKKILTPLTLWSESSEYINFDHEENAYVDFNRERLIYHMMSTQGPKVAQGDINGDGLLDIVIPGAKGFATSIYMGEKDGKYKLMPPIPVFEKYKEAEHIKALLFDADGDGDIDLYLASGGTEISEYAELLNDLIFFNDGKGNFSDSGQKLPNNNDLVSTGDVSYGDLDGDGDMDLFVGERVKIGRYGAPCSGYILINDGKGKYQDMTSKWSTELKNIGLITSSVLADVDGDKKLDLIVAGEFMPVTIFKNNGTSLTKMKEDKSNFGWWNTLALADLDNDGDLDIIAGNHGQNSRFKASTDYPIKLLYSDFDANGDEDPVFCKTYPDGKDYPYALRHHLMARMPMLKKKYQNFESFKNASMADIFTSDQLKNIKPLMVDELRSCVFMNDGHMKFRKVSLPSEAQYSPVYAICIRDVNGDKYPDLILGGNLFGVQPEVGRYDASYGNILVNDGKANFKDESIKYGFSVKGEIRSIINDGQKVHVFRNNDHVVSYKIPIQ
jgi:hypothetical protein